MKQSQLIKCFSLLPSSTAGVCIFHHCRHLLLSSETQRRSGTKTLFLDYFSLSICQCHARYLHSPQLSHQRHTSKCKSSMKSTYCKTHALARDLGIYIVLEPAFAFSLWNILAFKSMGPFNMGVFNANVPECQHLVACSWTFEARNVAIPIFATYQLPKSLRLWLIYISPHDFYLKLKFSSEEPALTATSFWTIIHCCNLTTVKLKRKLVYQHPMSFHFCRKAPDPSV